MTATITKARLLDEMRAAHAAWQALLGAVGEARMTEPGATGDWTVKDVIAHIAWCQREVAGVLKARAVVGSDLWRLSDDERNAAVVAEYRDRPLSVVLAEADAAWQELLAQVTALAEEDLHDPGRYANMPRTWVPWQLIDGNAAHHYRAHLPPIERWLAGHGG
jgi:hypothetical protein